jgi:histidinol-phosphate/aromatic aminotransferase/cobyric acid decarboxylase-like protein
VLAGKDRKAIATALDPRNYIYAMRISPSRPSMRISLATSADRLAINRIRHSVYALELGDEGTVAADAAADALDAANFYIIACDGDEIAGFVSITPPDAEAFAIDRYFDRATIPIAFDDRLYEVRILTVASEHRGRQLALALAYAALRWIEHRGGRHVVAIGRVDLIPFYRKLGLVPLDLRMQSGATEFELLHAGVPVLRRRAGALADQIGRLRDTIEWDLPLPFAPEDRRVSSADSIAAIGDRFEGLDRATGIISADVLDAWFPPSPRAVDAITRHLGWLLRAAPPADGTGLRATIAETRGLDPEAIALGAGTSDLAYRILPRWLDGASRALLLDPSYGEYAYLLEQIIGCAVDHFPLDRHTGFIADIEALAAQIAAGGYDLVVIVNPNNPTGQVIARSRLARIFSSAPTSTRFWIDEAFIEYAGSESSVEPFAATTSNVVVCKSLSSAYALGGARAAYIVTTPDEVRAIQRVTPPWLIGLVTQVAAIAAIGDPEYYRARYVETAELRDALAADIRRRCGGVDVITGQINALMCELPLDGPAASEIVRRCATRDVYLRDAATMGRATGDHLLRITVRDRSANTRIVDVLSEAIGT